MDIKKIKDFILKTNSSFRKTFLFFLFILMMFFLGSFNVIGFTSSIFWTFIIAYIIILSLISPESATEFRNIVLIMILISFTIIIIFAWLSGGNIPKTSIKADNNTMITIFTVVLAIATIINVITYKQSIGFSRLTELDFYLNKILCVEVTNNGNYPARGIKLNAEIINERKTKELWIKIIKDSFTSPEYKRSYLASRGHYAEKLKDYLEERFNLNYNKKEEKHTSVRKTSFKIRLTLNYYSDTFFKNPFPIIKEYEIEVSPKGVKRKEVNLSNNL